jgi:hypothetical protein
MEQKDVKKVSFLLPIDTYTSIRKLSAKNLIVPSEQIRRFIDKGLSIEAINADMDNIQEFIDVAVKNAVSPFMNRIIALVVKNTIVGASSWFMNVKALENLIAPHLQQEFNDNLAFSKKAGVAYLKMKDTKEGDILNKIYEEVKNEYK